MKTKSWIYSLVVVFVVWAGAAQAATVTWTYASKDSGATWKYGEDRRGNPLTQSASEFNITFSQPFENLSSTFAYCVELSQSISFGTTYTKYTSQEVFGSYLGAAWLIEQYIPNPAGGVNLTGATDIVLISALQSAIWTVTGQNTYNPIDSNNAGQQKVYEKYTEMITAYNTAVNNKVDFAALGLQKGYQLLVSNKNQDIIVRTSAVPVPAAVWMLGSGLVGLLGLRWSRKE